MIAALEASTGLDLEAYAAAWIHGTGAPVWPTVDTTFTPGASTSSLRVHQVGGTERRCKFHVALRGATPDEVALIAVDTFTGGLDQTFEIPTPAFAVMTTEIDPQRECLVFPGTLVRTTERIHPWRSERGRAADTAQR